MSKKEKVPKKPKTGKQKIRSFFVFLLVMSIFAAGFLGYLIYNENEKRISYVAMAADLVNYKEVDVNGVVFYEGNYKYVIDKKTYYYKYPELSNNKPEKIIQIQYNKDNPKIIYNPKDSNKYFSYLFTCGGIFVLCFVIIVALSESNLELIMETQVIEHFNCVGGRRIYLSDTSIASDSPDANFNKYFVFFSNDFEKFKVGNYVRFNLYKYGDSLTSEKYRTVNARTLYGFKDEDFEVIKK